MKKYKLSLTEKQARIVQDALETHSRVLIGQLEYVEEVWRWRTPFTEEKMEKMEGLRHTLGTAKQYIGQPPNGHFGIHNNAVSDDARKAYDIQQVMRYVSAWDREGKDPENDERDWSEMMGVNFDTPRASSTDEEFGMPTMEVVEDGQ